MKVRTSPLFVRDSHRHQCSRASWTSAANAVGPISSRRPAEFTALRIFGKRNIFGRILIGVLVLFLMNYTAAGEELWSRGFFGTPSSGPYRPFEIVLIESVAGNRLRAHCEYANYSDSNDSLVTIAIRGVEAADGKFHPRVFAKVANDVNGEWTTIGELGTTGRAASRRIRPKSVNQDLMVDLDRFRPFIEKFVYGAVVLPTGDAAVFELKDLLPPRRREESRDEPAKAQQVTSPSGSQSLAQANPKQKVLAYCDTPETRRIEIAHKIEQAAADLLGRVASSSERRRHSPNASPPSKATLKARQQDTRPPSAGVPARTVGLVGSAVEARLGSSINAEKSIKDSRVTSGDAIRIATRELQRRELPLPDDHVVRVEQSVAFREFASDQPIFLVTFRRRSPGISALLYDVHIDRQSGMVQDVIDLRGAVAAGSKRHRGEGAEVPGRSEPGSPR